MERNPIQKETDNAHERKNTQPYVKGAKQTKRRNQIGRKKGIRDYMDELAQKRKGPQEKERDICHDFVWRKLRVREEVL